MPRSNESFLITHVSDFLNLGVCGLAVVLSFHMVNALSHKLGETEQPPNATGGHRHAKKELRADRKRFVSVLLFSYRLWTSSWFFWFALYSIRVSFAWFAIEPAYSNALVQLLSDVHSAFVVLAAFGMMLAGHEKVDVSTFKTWRVMLVFGTLVLDGAMFVVGVFVADVAGSDIFLRPWSMALSVLAPFLIGVAVRVRYDTWAFLWVALPYAFAQPFAYGTAFNPSREHETLLTIPAGTAISVPQDIREFVRQRDPKDPTDSNYLLRREAGGRRLTGRDVDRLLEAFEPHVERALYWRAYLDLRQDEYVFGFLGLMKIVWCATFLSCIRVPFGAARANLTETKVADPRATLIEDWQTPVLVLWGAFALLAILIWILHGGGLAAIVTGAAVITALRPTLMAMSGFRLRRKPIVQTSKPDTGS